MCVVGLALAFGAERFDLVRRGWICGRFHQRTVSAQTVLNFPFANWIALIALADFQPIVHVRSFCGATARSGLWRSLAFVAFAVSAHFSTHSHRRIGVRSMVLQFVVASSGQWILQGAGYISRAAAARVAFCLLLYGTGVAFDTLVEPSNCTAYR